MSKYFKKKGEAESSKYLHKKEDKKRKPTKKAPASPQRKRHINGRRRYEMMLERDRARKQTLENAEKSQETLFENTDAVTKPVEELTQKKSEAQNSVFNKRNNAYAKPSTGVSDLEERYQRAATLRMIVSCVILEIAAILLQMLNFRIPLTPKPFTIDLSAIPELLSAVAFGPIVGIFVTVIKCLFNIFIYHQTATASSIANAILDSLFVIIASIIYSRGMFSPKTIEEYFEKNRDMRTKQILKGGIPGAAVTAIVSFFTTNYIIFPLVIKQYGQYGYTEEQFLKWYQNALTSLNGYLPSFLSGIVTKVTSLKMGSLLYNTPIIFAKLVFVTVVVAVVYKWFSDFFHYRIKPDSPPEE